MHIKRENNNNNNNNNNKMRKTLFATKIR